MVPLTALMGFLFFPGIGGTTMPPVYAGAPTSPVDYSVTLTAYNAVPAQTDNSPFETASGAYSNPEIIAARSQDLSGTLPFGTIIELDGPTAPQYTCGYSVVSSRIGYRVIEDTMNARYTNRIDVLLGTAAEYVTADKKMKNAAQVLGVCSGVTIRVVGHIGINHLPKTQSQLAAIVAGTTNTLAIR